MSLSNAAARRGYSRAKQHPAEDSVTAYPAPAQTLTTKPLSHPPPHTTHHAHPRALGSVVRVVGENVSENSGRLSEAAPSTPFQRGRGEDNQLPNELGKYVAHVRNSTRAKTYNTVSPRSPSVIASCHLVYLKPSFQLRLRFITFSLHGSRSPAMLILE